MRNDLVEINALASREPQLAAVIIPGVNLFTVNVLNEGILLACPPAIPG
jgi:hypothetical protein